jgi:hypothetical protein
MSPGEQQVETHTQKNPYPPTISRKPKKSLVLLSNNTWFDAVANQHGLGNQLLGPHPEDLGNVQIFNLEGEK